MQYWIFVFIGGGIGSICRYGLSEFFGKSYPIGTWIANIVGCFIIGVLINLASKQSVSPSVYALVAIGFCGGFTTFSSFSAENINYIIQAEWHKALIYVMVTIVPGFLFVFLGLKSGELIN